MDKPIVIFRADGHAKMGLGHLVRSSALAEMLSSEFYCVLVYRDCPEVLLVTLSDGFSGFKQLTAEAGSLEDAQELVCYAAELATNEENSFYVASSIIKPIIVLDGYVFRTDYQRVIKEAGYKLCCIDDIHDCHFLADVIINHAGGVQPSMYSRENYAKLLLGPRYALLRKPFRALDDRAKSKRSVSKVFVCLGGADPQNDTIRVLQLTYERYPQANYDLVLGGAYLHLEALKEFIRTIPINITLHQNLDAVAMKDLMQNSDLGITPASTIAFEYLSVGGDLFLVQIADNQKDILRYFLDADLAMPLVEFPVLGIEQQKKAREQRAYLFDGKSGERYLQVFTQL